LAQFIAKVDDLRSSAGNIGVAARAAPTPLPRSAPARARRLFCWMRPERAGEHATMLILTLFLLAGGRRCSRA